MIDKAIIFNSNLEHLGKVQTLKVKSLNEKDMVSKYTDLMSQTNADDDKKYRK